MTASTMVIVDAYTKNVKSLEATQTLCAEQARKIIVLEAALRDTEEHLRDVTKSKSGEVLARIMANKALNKAEKRTEGAIRQANLAKEVLKANEELLGKLSPQKRTRTGEATKESNLRRWVIDGKRQLEKVFNDDQLPVVIKGMFDSIDHPDDQHTRIKNKLQWLYINDKASFYNLIPPEFLKKVQHKAAIDVSDRIQEHWSVAKALYLKELCLLSRKKYNRLREGLTMIWSEKDGTSRPIALPHDVPMPRMPTIYALTKKKMAIREQHGVTLNGHTVELDVGAKLKEDIKYSLERNFYELKPADSSKPEAKEVCCKAKEGPIQVQFMCDAAGLCKGLTQTVAGYHLVHGSQFPNSPHEFKTIALMEGSDKWKSLQANFKPTIARLNELMATPTLEIQENITAPLEWLGGGDLAAICSALGLNGCASCNPCYLCECPRTSMCDPAPAYTARTLDRILLLAHMKEGKCPGCKFNIVAEVKNPKKQMPLAETGAPTPVVPKMLQGRNETWAEMHFGVAYGQHPHLSYLEPSMWIVCILHMLLRVTSGLVTKTVFDNINKAAKVAEGQEQQMTALLVEAGVHIKASAVKTKSKNMTKAKQDFKQHSFSGNEAKTLMELGPKLLAITCPADERKTNRILETNFQRRLKAWSDWKILWDLVNEKRPTEWEKWGEEVRVAARAFVKSWIAACGRTTKGVYLHILVAHLGDFIAKYGDLSVYSSQGMEHAHKLRKQFAPLGTNFKPYQRGLTHLDHILTLEFASQQQGLHQFKIEFEKERQARIARSLRKAKKLASLAE